MRNKYSTEFIEWLRVYAPSHSMNEIIEEIHLEKHKVETLLWRHKIKHKDYNSSKANKGNSLPDGTEYVKNDGMTLVKVGNSWKYKQRLIYEKYHKITLPTETMVIFLDGDRTNFDINNLRAVTTPVYNTIKNKHLVCNNKDVMNTALDMAELYQEVGRG